MIATRLLLTLAVLLAAGALLAMPHWPLPLRPGVVGLVAMLAAAAWWRKRWLNAGAPEAAQRSAHGVMKGTALVLGFVLASLWQLGPALALHAPAVQHFGVDTWTMVIGLAVMQALVRPTVPRHDEHDAWLAARGTAVAHGALLALLLVLALGLAFGPQALLVRLSPAMVALWLVCAWMSSELCRRVWMMWVYQRERAAA